VWISLRWHHHQPAGRSAVGAVVIEVTQVAVQRVEVAVEEGRDFLVTLLIRDELERLWLWESHRIRRP